MEPSMQQTRVDSVQLKEAVNQASSHILEAMMILGPFLANLTDSQRHSLPKARAGFSGAANSLTRAVAKYPQIGTVSGFDPEAVEEDVRNSDMLTVLSESCAELSQRVADTRLLWTAEALVPSLAAYAVAKVMAKTNGQVREVVDPLADVFAIARKRANKAEEQK
jgi:hypothetical protein